MKNKIKNYVNKENAKKVLKVGCLAGLVYASAALAIKNTKFDIRLISNGEKVGFVD